MCAIPIKPNAVNMCAQCLQTRYDISEGIAKQVQQNTCRGCGRFERRDGSFAPVEPESTELMALLLKKPRGLGNVRLVDASFIWTEPHSRRIKIKVCIQKEVVSGAVMQQSFVVEYVIGNKQCGSCQRREAKDTWSAVAQVRQKVAHKRTFLMLEQLILKHRAHVDTVNIVEMRDGLDFYFDHRSHAEKMVSFFQTIAPVRMKVSKQVISEDTHTGKGKQKYTFSVEVVPICKDDLVWLPKPTAAALGQMSQLALCSKVSNVVQIMDPKTLQAANLQVTAYWKAPFTSALTRAQLVEFVVLDLEYEAAWRGGGGRQKRDAWARAEATVARRSDLGANDTTFTAVTHLGNLLRVGDNVWGYCVSASQLATDEALSVDEAARLPDVVLVKKSYSERRRRQRKRRGWKLRAMQKEQDPGVVRGRTVNIDGQVNEYEDFMQDLEEDPTLRQQINLYRAAEAHVHQEKTFAQSSVFGRGAAGAGAGAGAAAASSAAAAGVAGSESGADADAEDGDDDDDDDDDDFPEVGLEELLDELTISPEEAELDASEWGPAPMPEQPAAAPPVPQFQLPEGDAAAFVFT